MNDIMKIVRSLKDSSFPIEDVSEFITVKLKKKNKRVDFLACY